MVNSVLANSNKGITKGLKVRMSRKDRRMTIARIQPEKSLRSHITNPNEALLHQLSLGFQSIPNHRTSTRQRKARNINNINIRKILMAKNIGPKLILVSTPAPV